MYKYIYNIKLIKTAFFIKKYFRLKKAFAI